MWPAFEALACAQAQNGEAAFAMSWALRYAFFTESRNIALRGELLAIAQAVAQETSLDLARFEADWDSGRYKRDGDRGEPSRLARTESERQPHVHYA
jgi:predicted DsbA family dithiol-disulfide isomerase